MEALKIDGLVEKSHHEMDNSDGGIAQIVVAAAVVGYGIYKLVNWATS